ncbi:MAG: hypothetical protein Q9210_004092 [Variospora velana]
MSIRTMIRSCLRSFSDLSNNLGQHNHIYEDELPAAPWGDEFARLRIWTANFEAHQIGQASLDFSLRDASTLRQQTLNLLHSLEKLLNSTQDISSDKSKHGSLRTKVNVNHTDNAKRTLDYDGCEEDSGADDTMESGGADRDKVDDGSGGEVLATLQSNYGLLVTIVQCLYSLARLFKDPVQHDFLAGSLKGDAAEFERIDQ